MVLSNRVFICFRYKGDKEFCECLYRELESLRKWRFFKQFKEVYFCDDEPCNNFPDSIKYAINRCNVFLVIISDNWIKRFKAQAEKRANDPEGDDKDWVKEELTLIFQKDIDQIEIIPILRGTPEWPPAQNDLPEGTQMLRYSTSLSMPAEKEFAKYNALAIRTEIQKRKEVKKNKRKKQRGSQESVENGQVLRWRKLIRITVTIIVVGGIVFGAGWIGIRLFVSPDRSSRSEPNTEPGTARLNVLSGVSKSVDEENPGDQERKSQGDGSSGNETEKQSHVLQLHRNQPPVDKLMSSQRPRKKKHRESFIWGDAVDDKQKSIISNKTSKDKDTENSNGFSWGNF